MSYSFHFFTSAKSNGIHYPCLRMYSLHSRCATCRTGFVRWSKSLSTIRTGLCLKCCPAAWTPGETTLYRCVACLAGKSLLCHAGWAQHGLLLNGRDHLGCAKKLLHRTATHYLLPISTMYRRMDRYSNQHQQPCCNLSSFVQERMMRFCCDY